MNRDQIMMGVFILISFGIFMYFQTIGANERLLANIHPLQEKIAASHRPRVITFTARWCGACQQFKPVLNSAMANYYRSMDCQIIDVDNKQNIDLVRAFRVGPIPATYVFDRQGKLVLQQIGFMNADELDKYLRKAVL